MKTLTIAVIAGDGVGQEVVPQAKRVLEKAAHKHDLSFAFQDFEWGASHFFRWGKMMPSGALDLLQPCDAILLGAVGHPDIPDHTTLNGLLLPIRRAFDQYANVRPAFLYPGVASPLAGRAGAVDRYGDRAREHRGRVRAGGRFRLHGAARRGGHSDVRIHPPGNRARGSLCFRTGGKAGQEKAGDLDHQVECARIRHGALGSYLPRGCHWNSRGSKPNRCWWMPPP